MCLLTKGRKTHNGQNQMNGSMNNHSMNNSMGNSMNGMENMNTMNTNSMGGTNNMSAPMNNPMGNSMNNSIELAPMGGSSMNSMNGNSMNGNMNSGMNSSRNNNVMNSRSSGGSSGLNGNWQTDRDTPHRREMIQHIVKMLKKDKTGSPEWLNKLPQLAKQLEVSLYRNAQSFDAYMDMSTLKHRLQQIAVQVSQKARGQDRGHLTPTLL